MAEMAVAGVISQCHPQSFLLVVFVVHWVLHFDLVVGDYYVVNVKRLYLKEPTCYGRWNFPGPFVLKKVDMTVIEVSVGRGFLRSEQAGHVNLARFSRNMQNPS